MKKIIKVAAEVRWWDNALAALVAFVTIALVLTSGCTAAQARADFHKASAGALGVVTAALDHPELLETAKEGLKVAAEKADGQDAVRIGLALDHLNAGNLGKAQQILVETTAASAPASSGR